VTPVAYFVLAAPSLEIFFISQLLFLFIVKSGELKGAQNDKSL
jgi:hypothetical protein